MSNVYSMDFTDSSSEKLNSSGMETYVLEWDSEDSEVSALPSNVSIINMKDRPAKPVLINRDTQYETTKKISKSSSKCTIIAQEIFTQTSKTIIELAESDGAVRRPIGSKSLETQTSFISITENKTVEYRIQMAGATPHFPNNESIGDSGDNSMNANNCLQIFPTSIDDGSSKFVISETENEKTDDSTSDHSSHTTDKIMTNNDNQDSKENTNELVDDQIEYENTSEYEQSPDITDMEEDSLMEPKRKTSNSDNPTDSSVTPRSVDNDVAELYSKLSESLECHMRASDYDNKRIGYLTPLTEESVIKKDSPDDMAAGTPHNTTGQSAEDDVLFTNNAGIKVKMFSKPESSKEPESFKLPPIQGNYNYSDGGNLNFLFSITNNNKMSAKNNNLPCVSDERKDRSVDRWEIGSKELAAGESPLISGRSAKALQSAEYISMACTPETDRTCHAVVQLPPIHADCVVVNSARIDHHMPTGSSNSKPEVLVVESTSPICIRDKIKELKMSHRPRNSWTHSKFAHGTESRSGSPSTTMSPDESRLTDAAERGCELLCIELLKKLRSHSWFEVADTLDDLPRVLDKFWGVIAENRIADLIRQVTAHVESPRTQVARAACSTLAVILKNTNYTKKPVTAHVESPRTQVARAACSTLAVILKNTNYTKKPDFYEAVTILLIKTGSFSRPVRRAANVALDDIVCGVDLSHAVTALCIHGSGHKSALVRCAAARLLVVCCALGGGGRDLLRARPPTAASARRHALRSLAALLDDKSTDARKYAERLYLMLRPLSNFEAYYLTDVDVEVASRQMKKYDQQLLCGSLEGR
uniref:TOG domain-containing protein n=1 Tax=Heliothis virescens TaxID=7102 RepID=A0A2A4J720_HELVI